MGSTEKQLRRLKWLTVIVPAIAVFFYETVRHDWLEDIIPTQYGNIVVGVLTLVLAYVLAEILFSSVERLYRRAVVHERDLAALRATTREQERLSRELHDGLAQVVSYLMLRLDIVENLVRAGRNDEALREVEGLRTTSDGLYADIRESISGLRNRVVEQGLEPALRSYVGEYEERHGIAVNLDIATTSPLPAGVSMELFRIAQEALTNVRKHAGANNVAMAIERHGPEIEMRIEDDGCGFEATSNNNGGRFGLESMRERAEILGGSCVIETEPGRGTKVKVRVPVNSLAAGVAV